ncbi:glycosyltransferase family 4 protein [candidate division KSB1 bacterium]|nr:glycosyltransferase family 4 protein [candidate division KSB1 bacterium]
MKKVLIITYYFSPNNLSGAFRAHKFAKYLPHFNWQPLILTCRNQPINVENPSLMNELSDQVKIWRIPSINVIKMISFFENLLASLKPAKREQSANPVDNNNEEQTRSAKFSRGARILSNIFIPDYQVDWLLTALPRALAILLQQRPDVIITTSPPHSVHLLGLVLAKLTRKKWIVDFRDPWTDHAWLYDQIPISKYRRWLEAAMERRVIYNASQIIANTQTNKKALLKRFPNLDEKKVVVIPNGFDSEDFAELSTISTTNIPDAKFIITYTGYLYEGMADMFLSSLKKLLQKNSNIKSDLQLRIIGSYSPSYDTRFKALNNGSSSMVQLMGAIEHHRALEFLQKSDILLIFNFPQAKAEGCIPSKLYEYFNTGKPIIAIGKKGEASDLIDELNAGISFEPTDENGIMKALEHYYSQWKSGSLESTIDNSRLQAFDRKNLTARLVDACEMLC